GTVKGGKRRCRRPTKNPGSPLFRLRWTPAPFLADAAAARAPPPLPPVWHAKPDRGLRVTVTAVTKPGHGHKKGVERPPTFDPLLPPRALGQPLFQIQPALSACPAEVQGYTAGCVPTSAHPRQDAIGTSKHPSKHLITLVKFRSHPGRPALSQSFYQYDVIVVGGILLEQSGAC